MSRENVASVITAVLTLHEDTSWDPSGSSFDTYKFTVRTPRITSADSYPWSKDLCKLDNGQELVKKKSRPYLPHRRVPASNVHAVVRSSGESFEQKTRGNLNSSFAQVLDVELEGFWRPRWVSFTDGTSTTNLLNIMIGWNVSLWL